MATKITLGNNTNETHVHRVTDGNTKTSYILKPGEKIIIHINSKSVLIDISVAETIEQIYENR